MRVYDLSQRIDSGHYFQYNANFIQPYNTITNSNSIVDAPTQRVLCGFVWRRNMCRL